jgi:hypothetical protein
VKSLMRLLLCVLDDSSIWCCTSTTRDRKTIERRVEHEGLSFLTITLPNFCSDFERSLAVGKVVPGSFLGFKKRGCLPALLQGFTERVFDTGTGCLLDEPDICAIFALRQICLLFKKVLLPCSSERERKAYERFFECEQEVAQASDSYPPDTLYHFGAVADLLWGSSLQALNHTVRAQDHIPRHGPGATAERISGNGKYELRSWHERLQPFFPIDRFGIPNLGFQSEIEGINFFEPGAEPPVRVITVPKTLKTPRIIAIEPVCMQYTQQALMELIVPTLESAPLTRRRLNFTDQTENQRLALEASRTGRFATLDLKEASDRVSVKLVGRMLNSVPCLRDAVLACRSTTADVPGLGVIPLTKFASMGSALCFPIEAMVFYTIILSSIQRSQGTRLTLKSLQKASRGVRVYGDDIIVPVEYVRSVCSELEALGLVVNVHKSFETGKFRESCGLDAYDGVPVKPVYCRRLLPSKLRDTEEMLSAISMANQFYLNGYWKTAYQLFGDLERLAPVPVVKETSRIFGRLSYLDGYQPTRWDRNLHHHMVKGITVTSRLRKSVISGYAAMMKCFLRRGELPHHDPKHLERSGRPESVDIKIRWAPLH